MLILAILLFGMLVGAAAQLLLGTRGQGINWTTAVVAGQQADEQAADEGAEQAGDGLELQPSGIIGSIVGAILVTLAWNYWQARQRKTT